MGLWICGFLFVLFLRVDLRICLIWGFEEFERFYDCSLSKSSYSSEKNDCTKCDDDDSEGGGCIGEGR